MNSILKKGFKFIATHLISIALTLFLVFVLGWVIEKSFFVFSIVTSLIYIGLFYSDGWNWGRKEAKPYNDIKESPLRAICAAAVPTIIPVVFIILTALGVSNVVLPVIIRIWYFSFIGFFANKDSISVSEILLSACVIPITVTAGYFIGTKNFSVLEKIAFRKNKKKEEEKRKKEEERKKLHYQRQQNN